MENNKRNKGYTYSSQDEKIIMDDYATKERIYDEDMNKNQKILLEALTIIANGMMILEDAEEVMNEMAEKEIRNVLEKFEAEITEFDIEDIYKDVYRFEVQSHKVLDKLSNILKLDK